MAHCKHSELTSSLHENVVNGNQAILKGKSLWVIDCAILQDTKAIRKRCLSNNYELKCYDGSCVAGVHPLQVK